MTAQPADPADVAVMREEGDLLAYLVSLTGRTTTKPKPARAEKAAPGYHIPRPGAWPCGTAASGTAPPPCTACTPMPPAHTEETT